MPGIVYTNLRIRVYKNSGFYLNAHYMGKGVMKRFLGIAIFTISATLFSSPLIAEVESWKDLNTQTSDLMYQKKFIEAIDPAKKTVEAAEKEFGPEDVKTIDAMNVLGKAYKETGDQVNAEIYFKKVIDVRKKLLSPLDKDLAGPMENLAVIYADQEKFNEAEPLLLQVLEIKKNEYGENDPFVGSAALRLADIYKNQKKYLEAEPLYKQGLDMLEQAQYPNLKQVAAVCESLADVYEKTGRESEVQGMKDHAQEALDQYDEIHRNEAARQ